MFRLQPIETAPEQAANPCRPWPAAESCRRTPAPAAGARPDARAHRNAHSRRPDLPRSGTTTNRPSPAGPSSPGRSVPPAPAGWPAPAVGARPGSMQARHQPLASGSGRHLEPRRPTAGELGLVLDRCSPVNLAIRHTCASHWGVAGLDTGQQPEQLSAIQCTRTGASGCRLAGRGWVKSSESCPQGNRTPSHARKISPLTELVKSWD